MLPAKSGATFPRPCTCKRKARVKRIHASLSDQAKTGRDQQPFDKLVNHHSSATSIILMDLIESLTNCFFLLPDECHG